MSIHKATKYLIAILLVMNIVCLAAVPFLPGSFFGFLGPDGENIILLKIVLLVTGILSALLLFTLLQLYNSMLAGNPFSKKNPVLLGRIGILGLMIAVVYVFKMIFAPSFATMVIILVFLTCFLFCLTLKSLFAKAAGYKEENDLTI